MEGWRNVKKAHGRHGVVLDDRRDLARLQALTRLSGGSEDGRDHGDDHAGYEKIREKRRNNVWARRHASLEIQLSLRNLRKAEQEDLGEHGRGTDSSHLEGRGRREGDRGDSGTRGGRRGRRRRRGRRGEGECDRSTIGRR